MWTYIHHFDQALDAGHSLPEGCLVHTQPAVCADSRCPGFMMLMLSKEDSSSFVPHRASNTCTGLEPLVLK